MERSRLKTIIILILAMMNLALALSAQGVPYEMHIFPQGQHGLGLAEEFEDVKQWVPLLQKWLVLRNYN